jgi:hypothetical protein
LTHPPVVYVVYVSFVILSLRHYVNYAKPITTGPTGYPGNSWIESKLIDPVLRESMLIEQPAFRAEYSSF